MEKNNIYFAGRGFWKDHVSLKQPAGDVDDHFFILNSRHAIESGLYNDSTQIDEVRELIDRGACSEGILGCLVSKVTKEENIYMYSDMSECEVLPSDRTDERYTDNVSHRTLPPVNFDKNKKFLHCDDYGHLKRIFEEEGLSTDLISKNLLKEVIKPWGKEVWFELNDKYCYKRLYVNQGTRTSYQYHVEKLETNYIIDGEAEVWLENAAGVVEKLQLKKDDFFTVLPGRKHRIIAKTDVILQEVSTPEVDDVVRLEDDSSRPSGRIESEHKS
jgi:mannose-6-phosphate isomerase-like protein (cupin superfamily)